jgi:hypothetical protein
MGSAEYLGSRANGLASVGSTLRAYFENPTGVQLKAPAPPAV